jgi:hypothetical protein
LHLLQKGETEADFALHFLFIKLQLEVASELSNGFVGFLKEKKFKRVKQDSFFPL